MVYIGTSGFQYPEWRGSFYPETMPEKEMLPYYAARFRTVEINYTFYRLPSPATVISWLEATPADFKLTLRASRRITHDARLNDCGNLVKVLYQRAALLGDKLGILLFQLPEDFFKTPEALDAFLGSLPKGVRTAWEFRSDTWFADDVYEVLRRHNAALCVADSETISTPVVATADYGYFRLRDEGYQQADIQRWSEVIGPHTADGREVYVYFKHESEGKGADFGTRLMAALGVSR
jgi:uncharacterized protein YecE (DUF72 family)